MAVSIYTSPSDEIYPGDTLYVEASGLGYMFVKTIILYIDGDEYDSYSTDEDGTSIECSFIIPTWATSSVEVVVKNGNSTAATEYLNVIIPGHTVTLYTSIDGGEGSCYEYTINDGDSFVPANYIECPSNCRFNYVQYGRYTYSFYDTFTITDDITLYAYFKSRPPSWSWNNTIASGYEIKISASEWNLFTSRINAFREYVGLSSYSFTSAYSGLAIEYGICNQAYYAINDLYYYQSSYSMPSALTSDGKLYASFFTGITKVLNAVQ